MLYFICKFDILMKFTQDIPKFHNCSSSGMSVLSKCTIKISANTELTGDPMATLSFC